MSTDLDRLVEEHELLNRRRALLDGFLMTERFGALDNGEQLRLLRQKEVMEKYADILRERIEFARSQQGE